MIKMLAFDIDGTLLNTINDIGDAMNVALKKYDLPLRKEEEYPSFVGGGIIELTKRAIGIKVSDDVIEGVKNTFLETYDKIKLTRTAPFPNVVEVLNILKAKGYHLCVISNKVHFQSVEIINHYFPNIFEYIAGQKMEVRFKPDPEPMELMAKEFGLSFDEICYFGDSHTDAEFSINCGCKYFLFEHGYEDKEVLHKYQPVKFLNDAKEILEYF